MSTYKNTRPTIIHLPDGTKVMPGATFDIPDADAAALEKNSGFQILLKAGYMTKVEGEKPAQKADAPKPSAEAQKAKAEADRKAKEQAALEKAKAEADRKAKEQAALEKAKAEAADRAKAAKLEAVKAADADALLKLAEGETDAEVNAAIEARAAELAPKA